MTMKQSRGKSGPSKRTLYSAEFKLRAVKLYLEEGYWMNFSLGTSKAFPSALLNTQSGLISVCLQINKGDDRLAIFNLLKQDVM